MEAAFELVHNMLRNNDVPKFQQWLRETISRCSFLEGKCDRQQADITALEQETRCHPAMISVCTLAGRAGAFVFGASVR